jgi:hypothetical protein
VRYPTEVFSTSTCLPLYMAQQRAWHIVKYLNKFDVAWLIAIQTTRYKCNSQNFKEPRLHTEIFELLCGNGAWSLYAP